MASLEDNTSGRKYSYRCSKVTMITNNNTKSKWRENKWLKRTYVKLKWPFHTSKFQQSNSKQLFSNDNRLCEARAKIPISYIIFILKSINYVILILKSTK